ncbi:MAG: YcjF family protein [Alkaliphilus sp.]
MIRQHKKMLNEIDYFRLSIHKKTVPDKYLDWDRLTNWSLDNLDDSLKSAFIRALHSDFKKKKQMVNEKIVPKYTVSASTAALSPIPMSDSALLVPIQLLMTMHIMHIYKINKSSEAIKAAVCSTIISSTAKLVSKMLLANLLKLIPGAGSVAGAAINATVASTFTLAMGYTISELSYRYAKAVYDGENPIVSDIFTNREMSQLLSDFLNSFKGRGK